MEQPIKEGRPRQVRSARDKGSMSWLWNRAPVEDPGPDYRYAITIDAGSSGSRLEIYSWLDSEVAIQGANETLRQSLPDLQIGRQKKY